MKKKKKRNNEDVVHLTSVMHEASQRTYLPESHHYHKETPLLYPTRPLAPVGLSSNTETTGSISNLSIEDEGKVHL